MRESARWDRNFPPFPTFLFKTDRMNCGFLPVLPDLPVREAARCPGLTALGACGQSTLRTQPQHPTDMSRQYNKGIKKKRRLAYLKRKKVAAKAAKGAKASK
jgi:hypothetical protein